ncbi:MAG: HAD family hydrolase [Planctomycetia bacterium]
MPPEFVFLDLGRVIVSFDRERAIARAVAVSGGDAAAVAEVLLDPGLIDGIERGRLTWGEFHDAFCRQTGTSPDPAMLADAISDMFSLKIDMLPVMARLARSGCGLGILSNTCGPHWNHLVTACGYGILAKGLDTIVLSHEVGCRKPEPEIYDVAARMAGVPPASIFFTDDIPEHVDAARAAGWDAEVFTTAASLAEQLYRRGLPCGL